MNTYDYDMPGIAKKIEALEIENAQLVGRLSELRADLEQLEERHHAACKRHIQAEKRLVGTQAENTRLQQELAETRSALLYGAKEDEEEEGIAESETSSLAASMAYWHNAACETIEQLTTENARLLELVYGDGERDTNGYTVAALVNALQQYARRENWTRTAEVEYSIDGYTESGSVRLDKPIVWKCGSPGYLLAEAALNGDIDVSESETTNHT